MARFTQADITRALRGAEKAGLQITKLTIALDGTITIDAAATSAPVTNGSDSRDRAPLYHPELAKPNRRRREP